MAILPPSARPDGDTTSVAFITVAPLENRPDLAFGVEYKLSSAPEEDGSWETATIKQAEGGYFVSGLATGEYDFRAFYYLIADPTVRGGYTYDRGVMITGISTDGITEDEVRTIVEEELTGDRLETVQLQNVYPQYRGDWDDQLTGVSTFFPVSAGNIFKEGDNLYRALFTGSVERTQAGLDDKRPSRVLIARPEVSGTIEMLRFNSSMRVRDIQTIAYDETNDGYIVIERIDDIPYVYKADRDLEITSARSQLPQVASNVYTDQTTFTSSSSPTSSNFLSFARSYFEDAIVVGNTTSFCVLIGSQSNSGDNRDIPAWFRPWIVSFDNTLIGEDTFSFSSARSTDLPTAFTIQGDLADRSFGLRVARNPAIPEGSFSFSKLTTTLGDTILATTAGGTSTRTLIIDTSENRNMLTREISGFGSTATGNVFAGTYYHQNEMLTADENFIYLLGSGGSGLYIKSIDVNAVIADTDLTLETAIEQADRRSINDAFISSGLTTPDSINQVARFKVEGGYFTIILTPNPVVIRSYSHQFTSSETEEGGIARGGNITKTVLRFPVLQNWQYIGKSPV